jgi:hypothetical protein
MLLLDGMKRWILPLQRVPEQCIVESSGCYELCRNVYSGNAVLLGPAPECIKQAFIAFRHKASVVLWI